MSVTRQNGRYFVRQQVHGRDVRAYAPSKKIADQIDASLTSQRLGMRFGLPQDKPRITFDDAFDLFLDLLANGHLTARPVKDRSVNVYREIRPRCEPLRSLLLDEIGRTELEFACGRSVAHGRLQSAARVCQTVKRVVRVAQERGYQVDESALLARVAKPKPRQQKALTWAEVELLAGEMPEHIHRGVLFLALTGLRVSEFCALTDADVVLSGRSANVNADDADHVGPGTGAAFFSRETASDPSSLGPARTSNAGGASYILVRQSKTDAGQRQVFLCWEAARLVREQMLARPNVGAGALPGAFREGHRPVPALLFPNERGCPYNKDTFGQTLRRAAKRAGLEDIHPHSLRATCRTLLDKVGMPARLAWDQLGWDPKTGAQMDAIYRIVGVDERPQAVLLLDSLVVGVEVEEEQA